MFVLSIVLNNVLRIYISGHPLNILKGRKPIKNKLSLNQKEIQIVTLYSTSRRAANRIALEKLIELYKDEIIYSTC